MPPSVPSSRCTLRLCWRPPSPPSAPPSAPSRSLRLGSWLTLERWCGPSPPGVQFEALISVFTEF
eukprot:5393340-Lingulodinium_polyedra.AAC.1